jgi:hypothetical protein
VDAVAPAGVRGEIDGSSAVVHTASVQANT